MSSLRLSTAEIIEDILFNSYSNIRELDSPLFVCKFDRRRFLDLSDP